MSIDHELDPALVHRPSLSINGGLSHGSFAAPNSELYSRDNYAEVQSHSMGMRQDEAAYIQSGAYTPDGYLNGPLSEATLQLRSFQFDSRSAPNGSGVRQSPHYSQTHTPPVIDHLYPSRSDQSLANGNNIALVENKLQRLQQSQQDRRNFMNPHQFQPHQLQHLVAANQFRHSYHPYQNFIPNNIGVNGLSPNLAVSNLPGMMPMIEPPSAPRDHELGDGVSVMSKLLSDFKANAKTSKRYELKEIYGHVVEFSGDQHGSRFIQQKLETANSEEKENVFQELKGNSLQLMLDVFGNYVIQKFFEHGDQNQKKALASKMRGHVVQLSLQMYGCRVVQKALEHVLTDQQALLVKELENDVLKCVKDQNGNHVIQKAIERVPAEHIQFIIQAFKGHVGALAVHGYGCRVIQRMLEHCGEPARTFILQELHAEGSKLISDQYGNYVTQHVIEHGGLEDRAKVFEMVKTQLLLFSKHKFASNVVEKCLTFGSDAQRRELMLTIAEKPERGESTTMMLIKDAYGNYVLQKLLDTLCRKDYDEFVVLLRPEVDDAKKLGVSLKQVTSVEKKMHRSFEDDPVPDEPHPRTSIGSATDISTASTLTPNTESPGSMALQTEATTPDKTVYNNSTASKDFPTAVAAGLAPDT
jgi:mRNA-binding protein PUF3